ncbi:DsbE family thiol:disulfide interchange protein [Yoonia sp. SDW83-1]|uniref:DsbE family thiol:disulfide interchange protein n=1 Tax=Yoonia sp. SDW83-1 TaxID=3366945 RepID=UPI00398C43E9
MDDLMSPGLFACVCLAVVVGIFSTREARENPPPYKPHQAAALRAEPVGDTRLLTDADLRAGEVTIVNFWASWCGPCRREHPILLQLQQDGYRVAGVNMRDHQRDAVTYLEKHGNPFFATVSDPTREVARRWGSIAIPVTYIVAGDGTVLNKHYGGLSRDRLEATFLPALRAAEAYGNWDDATLLEAIVQGR